jgi:flagellar hook protein FlgE
VYTRNGEFGQDSNGNVVSSTGQFLQVYPPLTTGGFNTGTLQDLNLETAQSAPLATTGGTAILNLPANSPPGRGALRPDQPADLQRIDLDHGVRLARQRLSGDVLFAQTAAARHLGCDMTVNGAQVGGAQTLTFTTAGAVTGANAGDLAFDGFDPPGGATHEDEPSISASPPSTAAASA